MVELSRMGRMKSVGIARLVHNLRLVLIQIETGVKPLSAKLLIGSPIDDSRIDLSECRTVGKEDRVKRPSE